MACVRVQVLSEYKDKHYGGRSWANELAKKGFIVLVHDSFSFGSRKFEKVGAAARTRKLTTNQRYATSLIHYLVVQGDVENCVKPELRASVLAAHEARQGTVSWPSRSPVHIAPIPGWCGTQR